MPEVEAFQREVWQFRSADWDRLDDELRETDWTAMKDMDPESGAELLTKTIDQAMTANIKRRTITAKQSSHP